MSKPLIVVGDKTSHGGTVLTGDFTSDINGKYIARVDDMTVCPKCKGTFPIATGASDTIFGGKAAARHGDKTACGATLISSQMLTTWDDKSSSGDNAQSTAAADAAAATSKIAAEAPTICLKCLMMAAKNASPFVVRA